MIAVKRKTRQYINGKYFDYPINAYQTFRNLGFCIILRILIDYMVSHIRYKILKKPISNFYDYALATFGKTLANFNIINYTEKIWGIPTQYLSEDWAKKRIKGLNVTEIILNVIKKIKRNNRNLKTMIETFYYPKYGAGTVYESIQNKLESLGYKINLNSYPTKIIHKYNKIIEVELSNNGVTDRIKCDYLIESIHIVDLIKLLYPTPPKEVQDAASNLKYRSQVYLFIIVDKERIFEDQWIYLPDASIPFARITEMKNFSSHMSPNQKTSLFIEFFCNEDDDIYTMTKKSLFELTIPHLEKLGFLKRDDIINYYKIDGGRDYPIFDISYKNNLETIYNYLNSFKNLFYIGRPGRFAYTSQDESIEMGLTAANKIIREKNSIED
jgi:protoporphyrinogen oxidase